MTQPDASPLDGAYGRAALDFARSAHRLVYAPLARPLVDAVAMLTGDRPARVLDVAAGTGAFGCNFADVVALDLETAMLAANPCRQRVRGDAARLPFSDDSFTVAASTFGINHVQHPEVVVREMARVAPVVGVTTWLRPEPRFAPKRILNEVLAAQLGEHRSAAGRLLDRLGDRVGSVGAVRDLLLDADLDPSVEVHEVDLGWPGADEYLDYRLGMPSTPQPADERAARELATRRIESLPASARIWRAAIVVGIGRRAARQP